MLYNDNLRKEIKMSNVNKEKLSLKEKLDKHRDTMNKILLGMALGSTATIVFVGDKMLSRMTAIDRGLMMLNDNQLTISSRLDDITIHLNNQMQE